VYGCENWSNTFRQKHGLKLFNKRVLKRIFLPKMERITKQKKLHK